MMSFPRINCKEIALRRLPAYLNSRSI